MGAFLSILAALIVLLLPGLAYQAWLNRSEKDPLAYLADAVGLSISLTALVGLVFNLLGIRPGGYGAAFLYGLCLVALLIAVLVRGFSRPASAGWLRPALLLLAGLVVLGGIIFFRFYQARNLVFPNWTDSVQHVLIVRAILDHGGLPSNLLPYIDAPFSYHYGFHLAAAAFTFWSHLAPDQAVLIFGNLINALVSLSIYRLGRSTGMSVRSAGLAGLLSGLALQMPAYYLTWGRYPLLTGLFLLCLAMAAALDFTRKSPDFYTGLRLMLLTAGVCLTHYLATVLLLIFFLVIGAAGLIRALAKRDAKAIPWKLAGYAALGGLIALPWLVRVLGDFSSQATIGDVRTALKLSDWNYLIYLLGPRHNYYLLAFASVGLIFAFRLPNLRSFAVWTLILLLLGQPFTPQLGPFRPDLYVIVFFLPAALLLADLLVSAADALGKRAGAWAGRAGLLFASLLLLGWGARETRNVINPVTVIANQADRLALEWVEKNTSPQARFYINATLWQANIYRGVDGGYWLLPVTARASVVPPIPYVWQSPQTVQQINQWDEQVAKLKTCSPEFWDIVRDANLSYVYVRDGVGALQSSALDQCPRLKLVYRVRGVSIYEISGIE